jgi:hypothetical protein
MRKSLFFSLALCISLLAPVNAQVSKFLKNVKTSVTQDLLGGNDKNSSKPAPEPPCACDPADQIIDLGKYKLAYNEMNLSVLSDGRVLIQDKMTGDYFTIRDGVTEGPIKRDDPRARQFENVVANNDEKGGMEMMYRDYIARQGDKYIINFAGKTYGPYGRIEQFAVSRDKDKFAAVVVENVVITEAEGEKMDQAIKNAKTEQEKMELSMKFSQQMQNKMMSGGGPAAMSPKVVTNVSSGTSDVLTIAGSNLNAGIKYNEILLMGQSKVVDLQGSTLYTFAMGQVPENFFLSSDNSKSASYTYGTITFSDGRKLSELFNPLLIKTGGTVYLSYMYFSPKRNSIMQCKIPF